MNVQEIIIRIRHSLHRVSPSDNQFDILNEHLEELRKIYKINRDEFTIEDIQLLQRVGKYLNLLHRYIPLQIEFENLRNPKKTTIKFNQILDEISTLEGDEFSSIRKQVSHLKLECQHLENSILKTLSNHSSQPTAYGGG